MNKAPRSRISGIALGAVGLALSLAALAQVIVPQFSVAQVSVDMGGGDVRVQAGGVSVRVGEGGTVTGIPGSGTASAEVRIADGEVFIDGDKVPRSQREHVSRRTGKTYRIDWGKNGNVAVYEK